MCPTNKQLVKANVDENKLESVVIRQFSFPGGTSKMFYYCAVSNFDSILQI